MVSQEQNPYLQGPFAPIEKETQELRLKVEGEIPKDLFGAYVRNGPNPVRSPSDMHHWFDGDGMLHSVAFADGRAAYRNRYIATRDHQDEVKGACAAGGVLMPANRDRKDREYKDTSNTDIIFHNGRLMTLCYISGMPMRVDPATLETIGEETFSGRLPRHVSAHSKADPHNGEFVFFDYPLYEPWMSFGVVDKDNELVHFSEVELPGPRLPHDMGLTENYILLHDLPITFTDKALSGGTWSIHQQQGLPTRFGVVPRRGRGDEVRWFETEPCYIYHVANCWEEGDEIVMHACKMIPNGMTPNASYGAYAHMVAVLALRAVPWEWRFNLKTGETKDRQMDDRIGEFPAINLDHLGRESRFAYLASIPNTETLIFDGVSKYDLPTGKSQTYRYEKGLVGSEVAFAPREGGVEEDDGYLVSFVTDMARGDSYIYVLDAKDIEAGPLARMKTPQRVPIGFHATWAPGREIAGDIFAS